jgi:CRP-like cAMP-binding protein
MNPAQATTDGTIRRNVLPAVSFRKDFPSPLKPLVRRYIVVAFVSNWTSRRPEECAFTLLIFIQFTSLDRYVRRRTELTKNWGYIFACPFNRDAAHRLASWLNAWKFAMPTAHNPRQNHLLAALPDIEAAHLFPHLELIQMPRGQVLCESGSKLSHVYFPTSAIVSLCILADGASTEITAVGNEGMIGVAVFMGGETTPPRAVVQSAGYGYRLKAPLLMQEFNRSASLMSLLLRYVQVLITQTTQMAACNRHHSVDQQLCCSLLVSLDRLPGNDLTLSHCRIADMLGARREGVTGAAGRLQSVGAIQYSADDITVLDRPALEGLACECYQVVKVESNRLLPSPASRVA